MKNLYARLNAHSSVQWWKLLKSTKKTLDCRKSFGVGLDSRFSTGDLREPTGYDMKTKWSELTLC